MDDEPRVKGFKSGWTDGRYEARNFEELALRRAQESKSPLWRIRPNSWVPFRLQLWIAKLIQLLT